MPSTLEEAEKYGFQIKRQTRYFGIDPKSGYEYALMSDWTTELLDTTHPPPTPDEAALNRAHDKLLSTLKRYDVLDVFSALAEFKQGVAELKKVLKKR